MLADGEVVGDGSWNLTIYVTDMNVERTMVVKGDMHVGGVMLKLVESLDSLQLNLNTGMFYRATTKGQASKPRVESSNSIPFQVDAVDRVDLECVPSCFILNDIPSIPISFLLSILIPVLFLIPVPVALLILILVLPPLPILLSVRVLIC
ncbi:Fermitin family homolog 2 [Eumeta japonica]|uniref:Fermitin family homolog 2 n=1 Tax=Eumeta variegata TaxID=151549 RepID=A0A4C1TJD7_EUMVA|nr:Fermitin family homolog 2 [Eumeta japonica]